MTYNLTNWTSITNPATLLAVANTNTGGYFWAGMLFMIFGVLLISFTGLFGWEAGLLASSFLAMLIGIFLVYLDLMGIWVVGIFVGIILLGIMYIMYSNKYD